MTSSSLSPLRSCCPFLRVSKESNRKFNLGAGKTTLLNFLSGREISKGLHKTGSIRVNGQD